MLKKIKKITVFLVVCVMVFSVFGSFGVAADLKNQLGDINSDGKLNAADARIILRVSAKLDELSSEKLSFADINGDDKVNASDARIILRIAAKLDSLDNYLNEQNTTQENPTEITTKEPVTEKIDVSGYFGKHINEALADFPDLKLFENSDDLYCNDYLVFAFDENGIINCVEVADNPSKYAVFGISYGDNINDAAEKLQAKFPDGRFVAEGLFLFDDLQITLYDYEGELYIVGLQYSMFDRTELFQFLGKDIKYALNAYPELTKTTSSYFDWYTCADFAVVVMGGRITEIHIYSDKYNVYGAAVGAWNRDAVKELEKAGFEFKGETGTIDEYSVTVKKNLLLRVEQIILKYTPEIE